VFNINVDLKGLLEVKQETQPNYAALQQSLTNAATLIQQTWDDAVTGRAVLPGMRQAINDDKYHKALTTGSALSFPTAFSAVVMPYGYSEGADQIENGLPAYDMKPQLLHGPKSRPTKDGARYNIIPFRHTTPGSTSTLGTPMPKSIFDQAKKLQRSVSNRQTGKIDWDQSLQVNGQGNINQTSLYQHKASTYQGMYRVGDARHTRYMTFRMVSTPRTDKKGRRKGSAPNSWIHPSVPPNPVTQAVYNYCMPKVEEMILKDAENMYD